MESKKTVRLARNAMATRFEFVLVGANEAQLRAAGEEALDEIERIESRLTLYKPASEVAQINGRAAYEAVRVSPEVFGLLERAREFFHLTGGSFDPTVGPLVRCWGFMKGNGARPSDEDIERARALVGMNGVELNSDEFTVRFAEAGMMLDLGSIGKGSALDSASEILRDAGVESALLHGGTSTIVAIGRDAEGGAWKVAVENPHAENEEDRVAAVVELENESLSVSAVWGKYFEMEGKMYGHVLDPRSGWPAENVLLGAVVLPSAAATDAVSTGVLLAKESELEALMHAAGTTRYLQIRIEPDAPNGVKRRGELRK